MLVNANIWYIFPSAIRAYIQAAPNYPATISGGLLHRVLAQEMTAGHLEKCPGKKGTLGHLQNYSTEFQPVLTCAFTAQKRQIFTMVQVRPRHSSRTQSHGKADTLPQTSAFAVCTGW